MTISIVSISPSDGALVMTRSPIIEAMVSGDPIEPLTADRVTVMVSGEMAVVGGVTQPGFKASVTIRPEISGVAISVISAPVAEDAWHAVEVFVDGESIGVTQFRVPVLAGPRIVALTPDMGSEGASTTPVITIDLASDDPAASVVLRTEQESAVDGVVSGSQLTCESIDFRGTEGRCVEVAGLPFFVSSIIGPHIVTLTSSPTPGAGLAVTLFRPDGLDVGINDNVRPVTSGEPRTGTGWTAVITQPNPGWQRIALTRTGAALTAGTRVDIGVTCADDQGRRSLLSTHVYIGNKFPPTVGALSHEAGSTGLSTAATPSFDVVDAAGSVTLASIQVFVGAVQAVLDGVVQGVFGSSTVTPIANGYRITLNRSGGWPDGQVQIVTVRASDNGSRAMPPQSWTWHFGTLLDADVVSATGCVRLVSFDFHGTAFAEPDRFLFTGYAADGWLWDRGVKTAVQASWATEAPGANRGSRADMPLSGVVAIGEDSWTVFDDAGVMWMRAMALASGGPSTWSMAGVVATQELADGAMDQRSPNLFLAAGPNLIHVSWAEDKAWKITSLGRQSSSSNIASRSLNQNGLAYDARWSLSASEDAFVNVCCWATGADAWVVAGFRVDDAELAWDMSLDAQSWVSTQRPGLALNFERRVAVLGIGVGPSVRAVQTSTNETTFAVAHGQEVSIIDWSLTIGALYDVTDVIGSPFIDDNIEDIDIIVDEFGARVLMVAKTEELAVIDIASFSSPSIIGVVSMFDLGLGSMDMLSSCAFDRSCERNAGYVYVGGTALAGDGEVVRYRLQSALGELAGRSVTLGTSLDGVSTLIGGKTPHAGSRYAMMSTRLLAEGVSFVNASVTVE